MTEPKTFDLDAWITEARRPERTAKIYARADLGADIDELQQQLDAETDHRVQVSLRKRINALRAEFEASAHTFRLRALSQSQMEEIDRAHVVPSEDEEPDEIMRALASMRRMYAQIAAMSIDPKMTAGQVEQLANAVGDQEFQPLVTAMVRANGEATVDAPFWRKSSESSPD